MATLNSGQRSRPYLIPFTGHHQQQQHYSKTISRSTNLASIPIQFNRGATLQAANNFYGDPRLLFDGTQMRPFQLEPAASLIDKHALLNKPLCRCRVMYLGSSVPHVTKNGLHGIQEPLKHLYPDEQFKSNATSGKGEPNSMTQIDISHLSASLGIDSWLSVWSNGLLLENVDELGNDIRRFFSIESLHYCAAVRFFDTSRLLPSVSQSDEPIDLKSDQNNNNITLSDTNTLISTKRNSARFLPLDAPLFRCPGMLDASHPPVFAAILRRTSGVKVLECHGFICRRDAASNALVRCCTHAYSDFLSARRLSAELAIQEPRLTSAYLRPEAAQTSDKRRLASSRRSRKQEATSGSYGAISTNTSNEEEEVNSNEVSSEDNYAIVSRYAAEQRVLGTADAPDESQGSEPEVGRPTDRKQRRSKAKGSSRSLFDDFQPVNNQTSQSDELDVEANDRDKMEKLLQSRSLDFLENSAKDEVQYAVAKSRRHSRSMQNLDHQASSRRAPKDCEASKKKEQKILKAPKARSCQEILVSPRKGSFEGRQAAPPSGSQASCQQSEQSEQAEQKQQRRRRPSAHTVPDQNERIYASCAPALRPKRREPARYAPPAALCAVPPLYSGPVYYVSNPQAPAYPPQPSSLYEPVLSTHMAAYAGQPVHYATGGHLYAATLKPRRFKSGLNATAKSTLANFRCLSPPGKLLGASQGQSLAGGPSELAASASATPTTSAISATSATEEVGYLSSQANKMSWIKRLSLTMAAGSGERHSNKATGSQRKRSSALLFPANLTLGRSKRQHSNLIA